MRGGSTSDKACHVHEDAPGRARRTGGAETVAVKTPPVGRILSPHEYPRHAHEASVSWAGRARLGVRCLAMGEGRTGVPRDVPGSNHRLTVGQAAERLGITKGAVRSRIKRGTLPTAKEAGRVYVVWGGGTSSSNHPPDTDEPIVEPPAQSELIESLQDQVAFLRAELERRGEEANRYQRIVAGLAQTNANLSERVRELEAAPEPRDEPETSRQDAGGVEDRGEPVEAQETAREPEETARRPWWVRWFGG